MKLSAKIMLLACLILAVPASSFALVDVGAYGGYSFAGELKTDSGTVDTSGFLYGFNAHVNFDMLVFFQLGIGGFYQKSEFDYDMTGEGIPAMIKPWLEWISTRCSYSPCCPFSLCHLQLWNMGEGGRQIRQGLNRLFSDLFRGRRRGFDDSANTGHNEPFHLRGIPLQFR